MVFIVSLILSVFAVAVAGSSEQSNELLAKFQSDLMSLISDKPLSAINTLTESGLGAQILNIRRSPTRPPLVGAPSRPVAMMHGLGDFSNNPHGMVPLAARLSDYLGGAYVLNVPLGASSREDVLNSFFLSMNRQVDRFAAVVGADPALSGGFNAIGFAQGSLVIRGYIEKYNNPPVLNFISMHGPLAGVSDAPVCAEDGALCGLYTDMLKAAITDSFIQEGFAPSNYYRDPEQIDEYNTHNIFLKNINNEISSADETERKLFKYNWASLNSLCLVRAELDTSIVPAESAWFQFYEDGSRNYVLELEETPWFEGDYFGLHSLHQRGRVHLHTTGGGHLELDMNDVLDLVSMYFL